MTLKEQLEMAGIKVDDTGRTVELKNEDLFISHIDIVAATLNALSSESCTQNPALRSECARLCKEFESGTVSHDWDVKARIAFRTFLRMETMSPEWGERFSRLSDIAIAHYAGKTIEVAPEPVKAEPVKKSAATSPRYVGAPEEPKETAVGADLKALGLLGDQVGQESQDPHEIAPVLYAMSRIASSLDVSTDAELGQLTEEYFDKKVLNQGWVDRAKAAIGKTYAEALVHGQEALLENQYRPMIHVARGKAAQTKPDVRTTREIGAQMDAVEEVLNIGKKMKAESHGPHINSSEYRAMKTAVEKVQKMVKDNYNPKDPASMREMQKALDQVNQAAANYVEKKVVGKEKKTDRGIDRKNSALALMQATNPKSLEAIADQIVDFRLGKNLDLSAGADRKKTSLEDLISAEKEANRRIRGDVKGKTARQDAAHIVRTDRQKKDLEKGINAEPLFKK